MLVICAALLVGLAALDDRAARREAARAAEVLGERAERAGQRASREAMFAPAAARTDSVGRDADPIVVPAGPGWGAGAPAVAHARRTAPAATPSPRHALHRIEGPRVPRATSAIPEPPMPPVQPAAPPAPAPAATAPRRSDAGSILLLLMGAAGLSMTGGGLRLISRRSA